MKDALSIRRAAPGDADLVLTLLYELAQYERLTDKFRITREVIERDYLGASSPVLCDLAFAGTAPVGVMTWYWIYASFRARRGIYLEDLYVREAARGHGFGKALLAHLAREANAHGADHIKWSVLDWNAPSIAFYEQLGAEPDTGWTVYSLSDDALTRLGRE